MNTTKQGILIAIEGIDGSGKSTLARAIAQKFILDQTDTLLTREPGATQLGKSLRALLQERTAPLGQQAEYLLFAADRAQHFQEIVLPALAAGRLVISDRMADSSLVYQGYGRGLSLEMLQSINAWVMQNRKPDITIYVRVPVECALERIQKRQERLTAFEQEKIEFTRQLVEGFETIFANRSDVIILDGQQSPDLVADTAYRELQKLLHPILYGLTQRSTNGIYGE